MHPISPPFRADSRGSARGVFIVAGIVGLVLACGRARADDPRIGDLAPALALPDVDGAMRSLEVGQVTLVQFSATWCGPCHEALPHLVRIATELGTRLLVVDVAEAAPYVRRQYAGVSLPPAAHVLLDLDEAASQRWGRHRFPTTFLVDQRGIIRFINRGYGPGYAARIQQRIRTLVAPR